MSFRTAPLALLTVLFLFASESPALAALPAPSWLPGQPSLVGNQVMAMWLPLPGAVRYILYVNGAKVVDSTSNQWIGAAPDKPGTYRYEVTAVDASRVESPRSQPGIISILALLPPGAPIAMPDEPERAVQLTWARPQNAALYNLFRAPSKDGPWELLKSVQGEGYRDTGLEYGKPYFYSISSKDVSGKESPRGEAVAVTLQKPVVVEAPVVNKLRILRTRETTQKIRLGELDVSGLGGLKLSPGGTPHAAYGNMLVQLSDDFQAVKAYVWPGAPKPAGKLKIVPIVLPPRFKSLFPNPIAIINIFFIDEGTVLLTEGNNSRILECSLARGEITWVSGPLRKPSQKEDPKTFGAQSPTAAREGTSLISAVKLPSGSYWVCEKTGHTWMEVNPKGQITRWFAYFLEGAEGSPLAERRVAAANGFLLLPGGDLFFESTVERKAFVVDPRTMRIKRSMGGGAPTEVGGFLGFAGASLTQDGKLALLADTSVSTVTVWDTASGNYLGSFGDTSGKPDTEIPTRPQWGDWDGASFPLLDRSGKRLVVFQTFGNFLSIREVIDPLPRP